MLSDMGITTLTLADGRVQLLHTFSNVIYYVKYRKSFNILLPFIYDELLCICLKAKTPQDSEEGLLFMQEMVELTKMQIQPETKPQTVTFVKPNTDPPEKVTLLAGPAQFGPELQNFDKITGKVIFTYPPAACTDLLNADKLTGKIVIMDRGNCMFIEKVRVIAKNSFKSVFL